MFGNIPARAVAAGASVSADEVGVLLQNSQRMPNNQIEIRWRPGDGDQMFIDSATDTPAAEFARRTAIAITFKGIPVSTGMRFRCVAVYEYQPEVGQGMVAPVEARNTSNNTFDQIINVLDKTGDWMASFDGMVRNAASFGAVAAVHYAGQRRAAIMV